MQGHVDRLRAGVLDGWAWNPSVPDDTLCIEIWNAEDSLVAIGIADQYRSDLADAGIGNGAHGFSIRLSSEVLNTGHLSIRIVGSDIELIGSPIRLADTSKTAQNEQQKSFDPKSYLDRLHKLDASYASAMVEVTRRLAERRQYVAKEVQRLNARTPGVINTLFNSGSKHPNQPKRDVIIFPPIDWDYRYQRPQQIASGLAALGHRVFYIAPTFLSDDSSAPGNVYDVPSPGVFLIKLRCSYPHPEINRNVLSSKQSADLSASINGVISDMAITLPLLIIQNPVWHSLRINCENHQIIYDCLDLISGFEATSPAMLQSESVLIESADMLIASSPQLIQFIRSQKPTTEPVLVRNATSEVFFTTPLPKPNNPAPIIGYLGAIESWFDTKLVKQIAELRPDWSIVLAGHPLPVIYDELCIVPNINFLGEIPANRAADIVANFDVAIIPFLPDGMTPFVNPVKVYEYLASGRGVVSCKMPELDQFGELVMQADDAYDFCQKIEKTLEENTSEKCNARRMRVMNETWNMRSLQISNLISLALSK